MNCTRCYTFFCAARNLVLTLILFVIVLRQNDLYKLDANPTTCEKCYLDALKQSINSTELYDMRLCAPLLKAIPQYSRLNLSADPHVLTDDPINGESVQTWSARYMAAILLIIHISFFTLIFLPRLLTNCCSLFNASSSSSSSTSYGASLRRPSLENPHFALRPVLDQISEDDYNEHTLGRPNSPYGSRRSPDSNFTSRTTLTQPRGGLSKSDHIGWNVLETVISSFVLVIMAVNGCQHYSRDGCWLVLRQSPMNDFGVVLLVVAMVELVILIGARWMHQHMSQQMFMLFLLWFPTVSMLIYVIKAQAIYVDRGLVGPFTMLVGVLYVWVELAVVQLCVTRVCEQRWNRLPEL